MKKVSAIERYFQLFTWFRDAQFCAPQKALQVASSMAARCGALFIVLCVLGGTSSCNRIHSYQRHFLALDTEIDITVYSVSDAASILTDVQRAFTEYDALWSISNSSSDTWKINHRTGRTVSVSPRTIAIARFSQQACTESHGIFDITVAPLKYLYGLEAHQEQHHVPTAEELNRVRPLIGCQRFRILNDTTLELDDGITVDFGGIAKGFLLADIKERLKEQLARQGGSGFLINVGGDIYAWGKKPDHQPWKIGVRNPRGEAGDLTGALTTSGGAVFTSGDYERYFVKDGIRYHHIFNSSTLLPARFNRSATVIGDDPRVVDTGVKIAFCITAAQAIDYLRSHHLTGIVIDSTGKIWISQELRGQFEPADSSQLTEYR
jgi:thiamine biosynthesis lipoprotein